MKDEGVVFKESLFILIMKYHGKAGLPGQATRLLLDMWGIYSCDPTFKSYNVVLEVLVDGNYPRVAPNVFYDMLSRGVSPTVHTFGVVMKALCMVNEVDSASSLLRDMAKHGCDMFRCALSTDVRTFNDVIYGLCEASRIHEAVKLLDRMLLRGFSADARLMDI
ncbi:unnamed protein product [Sphenostylis stenocarpa]|uniref:Pentatricopeptide repeat-containing protein n=1 Tax=Sphenostylis stenocarpa TaxID=92480 RepID=A0AA86VXU5_9FABA|nr:unnamed protein product [Sphenostylis stenocarpa]